MHYKQVIQGRFLRRPNRFIAEIEIEGVPTTCHVKNTGRLGELLVPGATVFVEKCEAKGRKTGYDLIAVYKGKTLVNIDSQAPNVVFGEWARTSGFFGEITCIKPETRYGDSRFDYYIETNEKKMFIELKGVTLKQSGIALFPDAPTERGIKHLKGLCDSVQAGYDSCIFFIVKMQGVTEFAPNRERHPAFAEALKKAQEQGVFVYALTCIVEPDGLKIDKLIPVRL